MSDVRERLVEAGSAAWRRSAMNIQGGYPGQPRPADAYMDAILAHPDDLIALLVQTGALESWDRGEFYRRARGES